MPITAAVPMESRVVGRGPDGRALSHALPADGARNRQPASIRGPITRPSSRCCKPCYGASATAPPAAAFHHTGPSPRGRWRRLSGPACSRGSSASVSASVASTCSAANAGNGACIAAAMPTHPVGCSSRPQGHPPINPKIWREHRAKMLVVLYRGRHAILTTCWLNEWSAPRSSSSFGCCRQNG
jgi:hypothetical protein